MNAWRNLTFHINDYISTLFSLFEPDIGSESSKHNLSGEEADVQHRNLLLDESGCR